MDVLDHLPKFIRVGAFDLEILIVDEMGPDDAAGIKDDGWGEYNDSRQYIKLRRNQPHALYALDTVMHELTHAIFDRMALRPADDEERLVTALASGWVQVYRDNPTLLHWIEWVTAMYRQDRHDLQAT